MDTKKLEEATKNIRALGNEIEIIADGKHEDNCRIKGQGINPFLMPQYAEGTYFCRICHHLIQAPFKEA